MHKVYALQIVEQKKKNLQRTTAAQRATRTSRRRNRESKHRYSVSVWQGCSEKVEPEANLKPGHQTPFGRIQAADGTKRGPSSRKRWPV